MNKRPVLILSSLILFFLSCQTDNQPVTLAEENNYYSDSTIRMIHQFQDERKSAELVKYFSSENARYRREAALSMASVQDPAMISYLALLLDDSSVQVRSASAYALGQLYDSAALVPLINALQEEDSTFVVRQLVESIGKVITQDSVALLYSFDPADDLEKEGLAWGLYRAGIRNVHDPVLTGKAIELLDTGNSHQTRLGAAHYLARTPNLDLSGKFVRLRRAASADPSPAVRMAIASALAKIEGRNVFDFLSQNLLKDQDYRVRINTLRSMSRHTAKKVQDSSYFLSSLDDENVNVRITAGEILATSADLDAEQLVMKALAHPDGRVKGLLFTSAVKNTTDFNSVFTRIRQEYENTEDTYYKAALLTSLGSSPQAYDFIVTEIFSAPASVVSTAGVTALSEMRALDAFPESLEAPFADVMKEIMKTGDIGMVYLGSQVLSDNRFNFREAYDDISFLYESKEKLSLPKDNEALQVLNTTIAYFEGKEEMPETKNPYNHPIDWDKAASVPDDMEVEIHTSKGVITMRMKMAEAPGSVLNFLDLAGRGYYDSIAFHRVVPNFVVQGGCPRGDGFGGEDYSIRSEFGNLRYGEGAVGMASAGKDTEGTQWFITHSPTPHLDGRYTIFAQVVSGMDVVHQMEVGDRILKITIPEL